MLGRGFIVPLACVSILLGATASIVVAQWPSLTIESGASDVFFGRPAAAFDQDNHLLVVYYHFVDRDLGVADLTPCGPVSIRPRISTGDIGRSACILVDTANSRQAVFWGTGDGLVPGVRYAVFGSGLHGDATAGIPTMPSLPPPAAVKARLDSQDRPYVLARYASSLILARFNIASGQWGAMSLGTLDLATTSTTRSGADLAVNPEGEPVIACVSSDNRILVGTFTSGGVAWRSHAVSDLATDCDIALACDPVGAPLVMCKRSDGLHLLRFHDLGVTDQLVEPTLAAGFGTHSLAVDEVGRVFLTWRDLTTGAVMLTESSFGWHTSLVDAGVTMGNGSYPAIALNREGLWAVAYVNAENGTLKVAGPGARLRAPGDFDCDGHVDQVDAAHLRGCLTGPDLGPPDANCTDANLDADNDVDLDDYGLLQRCLSGPIDWADPDCLLP